MLAIKPLSTADRAVLPPDVVIIDGTTGDFVLDAATGLRARNPIATAIALCLLTDARASQDELRHEHAGDARGWPGDGFDVDASRGETELGSKLWLYRRHELTDETGRAVEDEARRALQTLIRQGLASRIDVKATVQKAEGRIALEVAVIGRGGRNTTHVRFDPLWKLIA
ncbi:phage GP46 family protein [Microvirga sp. P5_D2]